MKTTFAAVFVLCLAAGARADKPDGGDRAQRTKEQSAHQQQDERVYTLAETSKPPRLTHQVNPDYSKTRGVSIRGSIEIGLVITSNGTPKDVRVLQGLQPDVDQCAVDAIKQWRFAPAEKDGKPVAVKVSIELEFHPM